MFNLFNKPVLHKHVFQVVAFDHGYKTLYTDVEGESPKCHHLTFSKCDCGERQMTESETTRRGKYETPHAGITTAENLWVIKGIMKISSDADVYDDDYSMTASTGLNTWEYKPITGVDKIIKLLQDDSEFQELCKEHPNVDTAFDNFEAIVKLHENI
jgi:hypothetical protein